MVTGMPFIACTTSRYASYCSSSSGRSRRFMKRNSLLKRPMPVAPLAFTVSTSEGSSMLAKSCTGVPSRVAAGALFRRFSLSRSSRAWFCLRRYSASTWRSGFTITTPWVPSTMMSSSSRIIVREWCSATMAGMFIERAMIAVCEVAPPRSVTNAANGCWRKRITSAGERSRATRIAASSRTGFVAMRRLLPASAESTRSATWRTSAARSRRYGSAMSLNWASSSSSCTRSAHSALQRCSRMISRGAVAKASSSSSMRCTFTKGASSAAALWRTLSASSFSSSRTSFTALS